MINISKKVVFFIGVSIIIVGSIFWFCNLRNVQAEIKTMGYLPPSGYNNSSIQVDKYENIKSVGWINENEVLTLRDKGDGNYYCGIYNLNTKENREFKDADIFEFYGLSPNRKYVLYGEERNIPEVESEEWQKQLDNGDLLHKKVKLLDLENESISELPTEKINSDAEFIWISNEKLLINYCNHWAVTDLSGNVYEKGDFGFDKEYTSATVAGVDDLIDKGNKVEGQLYYYEDTSGVVGSRIFSIDISSKQKKLFYESKNPDDEFSYEAYKKGNIIMIDNSKNNGKPNEEGICVNRTFGGIIMNTNGKKLYDFQLDKGRYHGEFSLSPDGKKVVYVESDNIVQEISNMKEKTYVKMLDTSTGKMTEVFNVAVEEGSKRIQISNLVWDKTGHSLLFTCNYIDANSKEKTNTYIISFDQ